MSIFAAWIIFSIVVGVAANSRGRSGFGWFLLALVTSPLIAGLLVVALPRKAMSEYGPVRISKERASDPMPAVTAPTTPTPPFDVEKWRALTKYDPEIAAISDKLLPLGQKRVDEFARSYLALNDKQYLPSIVRKILDDARAEEADRQERARSAAEKAEKAEAAARKNRNRVLVFSAITASAAVIVVLAFWVLDQNKKLAEETRLQNLRATNPASYLAELKFKQDPRWEVEFKAIDPQGYSALIKAQREAEERTAAEQRRLAEEARRAEIATLRQQLKTLGPSQLEKVYVAYARLVQLDPDNHEYKQKRESSYTQWQEQIEQAKHPENYVKLENFSWEKGGFDNIMIANFTIKNHLKSAVKDIELTCRHSAASGTKIDSNARTIYDRIEGGAIKRITGFNMGFVHSQAIRSSCSVTSAVVLQ